MGFCSCINKLFLIILNFLIFALGVGVIILGSIVIHRSSEYGQLLLEGILTLPIWTLILGIIITMIGFFGCCGAMKENSCMLYTYASIVTILFLAELTLGILVALYPDKASGHIVNALYTTFNKYGEKDQAVTRAIDALQHDLQCCGVEGFQDWGSKLKTQAPPSCCVDPSNCRGDRRGDYFQKGCYNVIYEQLDGVTVALGIAAIILAFVQVLCIVTACVIGRKHSHYV